MVHFIDNIEVILRDSQPKLAFLLGLYWRSQFVRGMPSPSKHHAATFIVEMDLFIVISYRSIRNGTNRIKCLDRSQSYFIIRKGNIYFIVQL